MTIKDARCSLVDTHVHLQYERYAGDLDAVLERAAAAGVTHVIVPGTTLADSQQAVALAERYAQAPCAVYATVGVHPTHALGFTPDHMARLRALAHHPRVVAIGETGLDYYWPGVQDRDWPCPDPAEQRRALECHLDLAADLNLPVMIHDRDAHADTLAILRSWVAGGAGRHGTLHAYAAGPDNLEAVSAMGFYIGMDGPVTFKKAVDLHDVARRVDLDALLLETDGPYLTPAPHRGERNEPAYLTYVAERIAALRACPVEEICERAAHNAARLFNFQVTP
jgi:TatD DNase family protein